MPDESNNQEKQPVYARNGGGGMDRTRLLREATSAFLQEPEGNRLAARQYAALAAGFLPQVARSTAIDVARMLAVRPDLPEDVQSAFRAIGIRFRGRPIASCQQSETSPVVSHRIAPSPITSETYGDSMPDHAHLNPYRMQGKPIDSVTALALARAAERRDIADFSSIIAERLIQMRVSAPADSIAHMLREKNGEPAALIVSAIGGDGNLLALSVAAFSSDRNNLAAQVRSACAHFKTLRAEQSLALLAAYCQSALQPRPAAAQHVTVQSGQSLRLRATVANEKPVPRTTLSERLGRSLRK